MAGWCDQTEISQETLTICWELFKNQSSDRYKFESLIMLMLFCLLILMNTLKRTGWGLLKPVGMFSSFNSDLENSGQIFGGLLFYSGDILL